MLKGNNIKEKLKNNFKENGILLLIFAVIWTVVIVLTINNYSNTIGMESIGKQNCESVIELNENTTITQSMTSVNDAESISIKFATYARKNQGDIFVKLVGDQSNVTYLDTSIKTGDIQDNAFATFTLNENINKKLDQSVTLSISSNSKEGNAIGVYYGSEKEYGIIDEDTGEDRFSILSFNDEANENELGFKFLIKDEQLSTYSKQLITWSIIGYSLLIVILLVIKPKLEIMFPIIILVFGLIFMSAIIPLSPPDEQYHYEASFQVSNYILGEEDHTQINKRYLDYSHLYGHYNISGGYIRFVEDFNKPLDLSNTYYNVRSDIADMYKVCFVPQALGITLARALSLNMLKTFYTGRLFNLIFYIVCIYIAIKNTPIHKFLLGFLASLPIFIQTASSFSYDTFIISLCFIIISFLFKWKFIKENIKPVDYIFVLLCCIGLAPIKYVYGFLPLLFFFVPKERFKGKLLYKIIAIAILIAPGMSYLLPMILERVFRNIGKLFNTASLNVVIDEGKNLLSTGDVIANQQNEITINTSYMFEHPIETIEIFYRTVRYSIKQWFYNSLGRALSGETLVLPINLVKVIAFTTLFVAFRKEDYTPSIFFKICSTVTCAFIGLLIMVGMFLSWTEANQVIIEDFGGLMVQGVQGRYFCPLLPYFFLNFNNKKIRWPHKFDKYVILLLIVITFKVFMYILSYTFVN